MKHLPAILLIALLPGLGQVSAIEHGSSTEYENSSQPDPCFEPVTWRIGTIDPRYDIERETLMQIMFEINKLWAEAAGTDVLAYSDSGDVAVNLIYSEDQQYTENEQRMSERINEMRKEYFSMRMNYQQKSRDFQQKLGEYNRLFSEYADNVEKYNRILSRLTSAGAVSRNEDEQLKDLKKEMEFLERELDPLEIEVNEEDEELTHLSKELNAYADEINEVIYQYKNRFSLFKTFHQAIYIHVADQKKINVYQFENPDKLRLVMAHEVGHALGLSHVDNPKAVMHFRMMQQNERELKLTDDDKREIQSLCATASNRTD